MNSKSTSLLLCLLGVASLGKRIGKDALKQILRYAFHEMNLNRIGLDVIEYDQAGIQLYKKWDLSQREESGLPFTVKENTMTSFPWDY